MSQVSAQAIRAFQPTLRWIYLGFVVLGSALPWFFIAQFLQQFGLDWGEFFRQAFANPVAGAVSVDLILSSVVFWLWAWVELPRLQLSRHRWIMLVIATLSIGLSCSFPLFLYWRHQKIALRQTSLSEV